MPANQGAKNNRCIQYEISDKIKTDAVLEVSDKSSCLIGKPIMIANRFLNLLVWHLHEMVLIEPANILGREVGCDREDCLAWNLASFSRMFKSAISIDAFLSLASKINTQLDGQII